MMAADDQPAMSGRPEELVEKAHAVRRSGDSAVALALYRKAEMAFERDAAGRAHCLRHIGDLCRESGDVDEALAALREAERLYLGEVSNSLALANTVRLLAMIGNDISRWREARTPYELAAAETGLDLESALQECDRELAAN